MRDPRPPVAFVFAVSTTGVYCRPSCPARRPKPEHVQFFATAAEAERAGFRACKRCKPDGSSPADDLSAKITAACKLLENSEPLSLEELAAQFGFSPHYFHRMFKQATGLTPAKYAHAQRARRVRDTLKSSASVTDAVYAAGYQSSSRFYADADKTLGMQPAKFREGGADATVQFAVADCALGKVLVAESDRGICAITLGDDAAELIADLRNRFPRAKHMAADASFKQRIGAVIAFVDNPAIGFDLPLDVRGSSFQHRVWMALRELSPGTTITYSELAQKLSLPKGARAVATACAANPLAVAIPCHRVVRSDGSLSGYRWGVDRKRALLKRETKAD